MLTCNSSKLIIIGINAFSVVVGYSNGLIVVGINVFSLVGEFCQKYKSRVNFCFGDRMFTAIVKLCSLQVFLVQYAASLLA